MPGSTRSTTRYAAGLVAAVALAACGTGGEAPAAQTPVATSSAAASTSAVTPSATLSSAADPVLARIPATARPETMEGAEAFTAFYFQQLNRAWNTPDPRLLDGLYVSECKTCVAFSKGAASLKADGTHHQGETLTVTHVSAYNFVDGKRELAVQATQNAVPVLNANGRQVDTTAPGKGVFIVNLRFEGHWVVSRVQTAKS